MLPKVVFIVPPSSMKSGDDIISEKTILELAKYGYQSEIIDCWPNEKASLFFHSSWPLLLDFRLFKWFFLMGWQKRNVLTRIGEGDIVWINANLALCHIHPKLEKLISEKKAKVLFHTMDDWTLIRDGKLVLDNRLRYLESLIVSTPELKEKYDDVFKDINIEYQKEPINVGRFNDAFERSNTENVILWTGSGFNLLKYLPEMLPILEEVYDSEKFSLRLVSGSYKPDLPKTSFEIDWRKFDITKEEINLSGCSVGLAFLNRDEYDSCKGNYKVKTYLANGIPTVGTSWGYNKHLIANDVNGYLAQTKAEYVDGIVKILNGKNNLKSPTGIKKMAFESFSHEAIIPKWIEFFKRIEDGV